MDGGGGGWPLRIAARRWRTTERWPRSRMEGLREESELDVSFVSDVLLVSVRWYDGRGMLGGEGYDFVIGVRFEDGWEKGWD